MYSNGDKMFCAYNMDGNVFSRVYLYTNRYVGGYRCCKASPTVTMSRWYSLVNIVIVKVQTV